MRKNQCSTTIFVQNEYGEILFLKRSANKDALPLFITGIGGKVDAGENFLVAAKREVWEESGLDIKLKNFTFLGIENWYMESDESAKKDWTIAFFKSQIQKSDLKQTSNDEGELIWIAKEELEKSPESFKFVPDVFLILEDILNNNKIFMLSTIINEDFKVVSSNKEYINKF